MTIPVAILCGGHGTRSGAPINKCFQDVSGKPFLLRILEQYETQGFTTFVLCRGTDGTLNALRNARDQLGERFLCQYGDTYLRLSFKDFINKWDRAGTPSIQATYDKIDAGVNGFITHTLDMCDETVSDLSILQKELKTRGMVANYPVPLPYKEVGTPSALANARTFFS